MQLLVKSNQLLPKTKQYYTFYMIRDVIHVPYKSNLALISLDFREVFTEQIGFLVLANLFCSLKFGYEDKICLHG